VPDPAALLGVARLLADADASSPPSDAQLRRAVSSAYYAVFHKVLRAGARRFMGPGSESQAGYRLIYRGFTHSRLKEVCKRLDIGLLAPKMQEQLGRQMVGQDMRRFASDLVALQELRELADYDPQAVFRHSDAISAVEQADVAMQAFDRTPLEEQADVLALMLVSNRG
jgi:uncharacterized protein (UPF0332 family)